MLNSTDSVFNRAQSIVDADMEAENVDALLPVSSVIYSTLSVEGIQRLVVPGYNLPSPVSCIFFQRAVNDTYLLTSGGKRYALRVSRFKWRSRAALSSELAALRHLSDGGIEVAKPIARRDGKWITDVRAPEGIRYAVLFEWIDGVTPTYEDAAQAANYGKVLGRFHSVSDDLEQDDARTRMDLEHLLQSPLRLIGPHLEDLPSMRARLDSLVDRLERRLSPATLQSLDWGFCHGDVWAENAQLRGSQLVLFDFDCCGSGWRIYDIASYRWDARRQSAESLAWEPFIRSYLRERPRAAASLDLLGEFMILRHLWVTSLWIILTVETGTSYLPATFFEGLVPFCEQIEQDIEQGKRA